MADRFAAVVVVSGELTLDDCAPSRPVSVLMIHGTADENLPFNGGIGRNALHPHACAALSFCTWRISFVRPLPLQPDAIVISASRHERRWLRDPASFRKNKNCHWWRDAN